MIHLEREETLRNLFSCYDANPEHDRFRGSSFAICEENLEGLYLTLCAKFPFDLYELQKRDPNVRMENTREREYFQDRRKNCYTVARFVCPQKDERRSATI